MWITVRQTGLMVNIVGCVWMRGRWIYFSRLDAGEPIRVGQVQLSPYIIGDGRRWLEQKNSEQRKYKERD